MFKEAQELNSNTNPNDDLDLRNVTFVMLGNPDRNEGGLRARLPAGVYVPFLGLSFGASTNPVTPTDDPNAPRVILITKQYDGVADVPKYMLLDPLADINWALGLFYEHNYQNVDLDLDDDGDVDQTDVTMAEADNTNYVVTKNGNVTDVLIKNQPGELPITQPLRALGVPESLILALDPFLRFMIEAGYERQPDSGEYPAEPVHIGLIPRPGKLFSDFRSIAAAFDPLNSASITLTSVGVGNTLMTSKQADPAPPGAPAPLASNAKKGQPVLPFVAPQRTPPRWTPRVTTKLAPPSPPAEEEFVPPADDPIIIEDANSSGGPQPNVVRGPIGGSPAPPRLKKIATAINGVMTGIQNALTPKPAGTSNPAPASKPPPEPEPERPSDPNPPADPGTAP